MGHGGGQVVSVLAFYYDVPSSNPAKVQKIWPIFQEIVETKFIICSVFFPLVAIEPGIPGSDV